MVLYIAGLSMLRILAIYDGKLGHYSQLEGVVDALFDKCNVRSRYLNIDSVFSSALSFLSPELDFLLNSSMKKLVDKILAEDNYNLILAIGRRTLGSVIYIDKQTKINNSNAKTIYLMPPKSMLSADSKFIDYVFYHSYKGTINLPNYYPIVLSPHNITNTSLREARSKFSWITKLPRPITSVLIGGNAKGITMNKASVDEMVEYLLHINKKISGSFLVLASRRTSDKMQNYLMQALSGTLSEGSYIFWNNNSLTSNPYMGALAYGDNIIVTGESISMISEACSLPSTQKVYIFFSKNFYSKRYINFHHNLYNSNYAHPIEDLLNGRYKTRIAVNITDEIAKKIASQIVFCSKV